MANRDMLAEAIADAKALKETAIANAKAALEEAFEPRLKSMLSAKLQEMEDEDLKEAEEIEEAKEEVDEMSNPVMRHGLKGDDKEEKRTEKMRESEEMDEEMDLDEILAELDKELNEDARTDAEEEGYLDGMHDEKEDLDEGSLDKLKSLYTDKELLSKIITVDGEKVSIKDLLALAGEGAVGGMKKSGAGHDIGPKEGMEEMDEMKKELDELRSELHEVNLLNAKLLYTNKIFRAKNLQEAQKVKVLEAFDKASNVSEVKLVFETLNEGIKTTPKTQIKESLGSASKAVGVAQKAPIVEVDAQVARWQKLAGIK